MKEEVKQAIQVLNYKVNMSNTDAYIGDLDKENIKTIKTLLDYITTLQEENKEAHDFDETMKDIKENLIARINRQECEIHNLKEENKLLLQQKQQLQVDLDKATKFIEENLTFYITIGGTDERKLIGYNKAFEDLLKILEGKE